MRGNGGCGVRITLAQDAISAPFVTHPLKGNKNNSKTTMHQMGKGKACDDPDLERMRVNRAQSKQPFD